MERIDFPLTGNTIIMAVVILILPYLSGEER